MDTGQLLLDRGATHGDFRDHARITQKFKFLIWSEIKNLNKTMSNSQMEALEMISHKIGRIIAGDPNFADHWDDIAGYAKLVAEQLRK